ncbi:hypothetical protein LTR56_009443 [Elasticomyces elasticus]|nr:hypothetical protein LTR56_009443 [Elasticomyces elasticus]KAK3645875.1 hypothetical protein LTR22_014541 [Elasticomyces elasticus]KAK4931037.1 hypothetical protein LTR49_002452 [Elasticomyces elasticus]KAK5765504.1 hypothetical protein LTS12_004255 [Elasticomyces elasticus]
MAMTERGSIGGADISIPEHTPTSHFLSLPPELRNRIYKYVMTVGTVYVQLRYDAKQLRGFVISTGDEDLSSNEKRLKVIRSAYELNDEGDEQPAGHALSLLRTCKQANKEAAQLFYVCNTFEVQGHLPKSRMEDGLVHRGLFEYRFEADLQLFVSALWEFVETIGTANAKVLSDVVFSVGQIDEYDLDDDQVDTAAILDGVRGVLRPFHAAWPLWRLRLGMTLLLMSGGEGASNAVRMQEVCLDMNDFSRGAALGIAALTEKATLLAHLQPGIEVLSTFLGKVQKLV